MRQSLPVALACALLAFAVARSATVPEKESAGKANTKKITSTKKSKKSTVHRSAARALQLNPTPDRYKEIQEALVAKGYLSADQANGQWTDASAEALKKFQSDQSLDPTGKINSLSLIALGLGPKHDPSTAVR